MSHDHSTSLATIEDDPQRYPVPDPGPEEHVERWSDVDPDAGNRAYRQVVTIFGLVPLFAIAFVVIYFAVPGDATAHLLGVNWHVHSVLLGLTGGIATLLIGIGLVHWARQLMTDTEVSEPRHAAASSEEERVAFVEAVNHGISEAGVARRKMVLASLGGALGIIAVPALVTLADLGPWPVAAVRRETIEKTIWADGVRVVNDTNWIPLKASDLEIGQLVNAEPENLRDLHGKDYQNAKAKAALIVVRMDPNSIKIPESRQDWHVGGILAYSKICTHVGCPISLWEQQTHHLLCPCHQSTFDLADNGKVIFGPAHRPVPQLPLGIDDEGYIIAMSDFPDIVAPSYPELARDQKKLDGE